MTIANKSTVIFLLVATGVLISSFALAATSKIAGGRHDFTAAGGSAAYQNPDPTATQTCIYCHTPHNAGQTRVLWNKDVKSATNFRLYTSSSTLSSVVRTKSVLDANSPSLLCLSCHDGKTAMNVLHTGGTGAAASGYPTGSALAFGAVELYMPGGQYDFWGGLTSNMAIGRGPADQMDGTPTAGDNLTDDHPIGFSYTAAQTEKTAAHLHDISVPRAAGIRFFGTQDKVECSTCHDPHINYNPATGGDANLRPFLVMSNSGSLLCLKCHNK